RRHLQGAVRGGLPRGRRGQAGRRLPDVRRRPRCDPRPRGRGAQLPRAEVGRGRPRRQGRELKLGLLTAAFPDLTLEEVARWAHESGFDALEIACWPSSGGESRRYAGVSHVDVEDFDPKAVRRLLSRFNLEISALAYYPNNLDPDAEAREAANGHLRRVFESIPDENFGLNFDPSHLVWQFIDYTRAVREFGPRIFHVHAKDMEVDRDGLYEQGVMSLGVGWQVPRLPGLGEVRWDRFLSALYAAGYDWVVSIEHEDRRFEGELDLVQRGFLLARDVLRPLIV